jgi:hypothetical protein
MRVLARSLSAGVLATLLLLALCRPAGAGIFGVPTNLDAAGAPTASSVTPPGWFLLTGTTAASQDGDTVHQLRLFIEVTGTTLDILVYDPGNSGARDYPRTGNTQTTYTLYNPAGGAVSTTTIGDDTATTDDHLVRFTPGNRGFYALNSGNGNNVAFSGLAPGLYEFRATMVNGTDVNAFGVDIRNDKGSQTPYNVYTIGESNSPVSAFVAGALNTGDTTPYATITQRMAFFPYVTSGCSIQTSNFDMDGGTGNPGQNSSGDITDAFGTVTALTMGQGSTIHVEDTIPVEDPTNQNLESINYGMYILTNNTGTQQNLVDWRVADFQGWNTNPAALPRDPVNPIRMYLPNGYAPPVPPVANAVAPKEPILFVEAVPVNGTVNPPTPGQATRFAITVSISNLTTLPITNAQLTVGLAANVTYVSGADQSTIDGISSSCTRSSGSGYQRCTFASLGAGSYATFTFQVDFTPPSTGLFNLTGPPTAGAPPPNTTVWAQYTPAFNSSTYPRTEVLGPVCQLVVNVNGSPIPVTRACLFGLRADPTGVVQFATGFQHQTASFNIYSVRDRRHPQPLAKLNREPILAPIADSTSPILYHTHTAPIPTPFLLIEEIETSGRHRFMGPFAIADPHLRASYDRVEAWLQAAGGVQKHGATYRPPTPSSATREFAAYHTQVWSGRTHVKVPHGIKMEFTRGGFVRLSLADLMPYGLPAWVKQRPQHLQLTNRGQAVAFQVQSGPDGGAESLTFTAAPLNTAYTNRNVYILSWDSTPIHAPAAALTRSEDAPHAGMHRVTNYRYYLQDTSQRLFPWVWDVVGNATATITDTFDLSGVSQPADDTVPVLVKLVGFTNHHHTATVLVNDTPVGSGTFQGKTSGYVHGTISPRLLRETGNTLTINYAAPGAEVNSAYIGLGYLEIGLPSAVPATGIAPDHIAPYDPRLPDLGDANYLILTHPLFHEQAEQIASLKRQDSLRPQVVDIEHLYDRFGAGIIDAAAIRAYLKTVVRSSHVRYVLLVGGDSFDPAGYVTTKMAFLPTLLGYDPLYGIIPSDHPYADPNGDGAPELAVGRLSVQSTEELAVLVDKIRRQASVLHQNQGRYLMAVDAARPDDAPFTAEAQSILPQLPKGALVTWAEVATGIDEARAALLGGLQRGALLTTYFGHGAPELWSDASLLTEADAGELTNTYRETVLFTWACYTQWFNFAWGPSINESLLLTPGGGALAAFGPSGLTSPDLQAALYSRVYRKFLVDRLPLGEAIRQAKAEAIAKTPGARSVIEGWNLLGDPALQIPR